MNEPTSEHASEPSAAARFTGAVWSYYPYRALSVRLSSQTLNDLLIDLLTEGAAVTLRIEDDRTYLDGLRVERDESMGPGEVEVKPLSEGAFQTWKHTLLSDGARAALGWLSGVEASRLPAAGGMERIRVRWGTEVEEEVRAFEDATR